MANKSRRPWKRSRLTTVLIHQIRNVIKEAGFDEELAVVPLTDMLSIVVCKGEERFNIRLNKETLEIVSIDELKYNRRREGIKMVFRRTHDLHI